MKSDKKTKTSFNIWKWLTIGWASYAIFLIVGIFFILPFLTIDFYPRIVGTEDYRSIYDWDYPSEGRGDFDNDGIEDRMTSGGCAIFGPMPERPPLMCEPYYVNGNQVIERGGKYPYHSYMIKENGRWFILVLDRNEELKKYSISPDKQIELVSPTSRDHLNEAVYYIPVRILEFLISPGIYLPSAIPGHVMLLLYLSVLAFFIYKWQK